MNIKTYKGATALIVILGTASFARPGSILQFASRTATVAESSGSVALTVQRTGDTNTVVSVDYATADGTATSGVGYSAVSGPLAFGVGDTNKTIVIPILNNGFVEGTRSFKVLLSNPSEGATLAAQTNITVLVTDNDLGTQFQFATDSVAEDNGAVVVGIVRDDDGILPVTVDVFTTDLTAKSGLDYAGVTTNLSFAPLERLKFFSIPILNNTLKQPNRAFRLTLANPTGTTLGGQKTETVTIVDNDQGFQFGFVNYSVAEDAGVARIAVLRGTDDTNGTVTVDFSTSDMTATNGRDYVGTTNKLSFAPGESLRWVAVPILNDGVKEPSKSFRLSLNNPTGGAVLGPQKTATVTIADNDPGVGFELASYSVWENAGAIEVTVLRGNDVIMGPISVDFTTGDLTARAGQDYLAVASTLAFDQNETVKIITIPILRDALVTNNTNFKITLSNPTGITILGAQSATVNIQNAPETGTFRAVAPPFDTALRIRCEGEVNSLSWTGGGVLQRADRPTGPWQTLQSAHSPTDVQSSGPTTFYRVTRPRPVNVYVPSSYDNRKPLPLVIFLHGYGPSVSGDNGDDVDGRRQLRPLAEARGFLYCFPESPADADVDGNEFWNATDGCCDFHHTDRDDAGYLRALIEEIGTQLSMDRKRVYLIGWSAGGFMAHRMACESADLIAGIVSRAGATFLDPSRCTPSEPVNILHVHGTLDVVTAYNGGADTISGLNLPSNMSPFPGARQTVQFWAEHNGASDPITDSDPTLDIDLTVPGLDTVVTRYKTYPPGGAVELWTINGASHFPTLSADFTPRIIDWLLAHPKP